MLRPNLHGEFHSTRLTCRILFLVAIGQQMGNMEITHFTSEGLWRYRQLLG